MYKGELGTYFIIEPNFEFAKKNFETWKHVQELMNLVEINAGMSLRIEKRLVFYCIVNY